VGLAAVQHVKEVGGVAELWPRFQRLLASLVPVESGHRGRGHGGGRDRSLQVGPGAVRGGALGGNQGAQRVPPVGVAGQAGQRLARSGVERARRRQLLFEFGELYLIGQLPVPEEVGHLLEGTVRHLLDQVAAAVYETSVLTVYLTDLGLSGDDAFEPGTV